MKDSIIFMFDGQGSQYYQMGKELFEFQPIFNKWMHKLDEYAIQIIGESIISILYDKKKKKSDLFTRTLYSHPAIFMIEYSLAQVFLENGIEPSYVFGTSMGEFASAVIAGVLGYEDAIEALFKQAELLENNCQDGGMLAIIYNPTIYHDTPIIYKNSELASINFHSHFVISGRDYNLKLIERFLKQRGISHQRLTVSVSFHSSLIDSVEPIYCDFLNQKTFNPPCIPLISCSRAGILTSITGDYFWQIIRKPVLFQNAIRKLEKSQNYIYLDLGPSGTLATFLKHNLEKNSRSKSFVVLTPFSRDLKNLEKVIEKIMED